jgi:hypothetical protein
MAVSSVASATSSTQLLGINSARRQLIITNDDANKLYVLLGAGTASATNYSFALDEGEDARIEGFTEAVMGLWAGDGSGSARITEY